MTCVRCGQAITGRRSDARYCSSKCRTAVHRKRLRDFKPDHLIERNRRHRVKRKYGLAVEEYDERLASGCALCGRTDGKLCLDHDHEQDRLRGTLCDSCNRGLGFFFDDPQRLRAAADYIESYRVDLS